MTRKEMVEYLITVIEDQEQVLRVTQKMNDVQLTRLVKMMKKQE